MEEPERNASLMFDSGYKTARETMGCYSWRNQCWKVYLGYNGKYLEVPTRVSHLVL